MFSIRARIRRFMWSPWAPVIIAERLVEAGAVLVTAVAVWLCFGGPVFMLYSQLIVGLGRAVGTAS